MLLFLTNQEGEQTLNPMGRKLSNEGMWQDKNKNINIY